MLQQWPMEAVVAIVAGVVILLVPRVLNYTVAAYLLLIGALGLMHYFHGQPIRPMAVISVAAGALILIKPAILNYVVGIYLVLAGLVQAGMLRF
ncbi:DUF3096 domain-containing protein [Imhoffiella purpurea]|uniref:DUF3096 domain-containing protein n=1 Tax=Imhoffiella purpurea TaxID=1249627 RepID=W9V2X7_9GAMM|nr:DUF3096 domain-containing protein [Imhoffiella purpurea]EXJ13818.1 hypothetical protein D779_3261 [Imhoffiella purpurea]